MSDWTVRKNKTKEEWALAFSQTATGTRTKRPSLVTFSSPPSPTSSPVCVLCVIWRGHGGGGGYAYDPVSETRR